MLPDAIDLCGARVLLVDDIPANLEVLYALLEPEGFEISVAPGSEIALRILQEAAALPDLILLDVMMPGIDGFEVCRRLQRDERTREIPVIFITALDQTQSVVRGFEVGGVDYIPKPFRHEEVRARVRHALLTKRLLDLHREQQEKAERELRTAHDLQMGLMPRSTPVVAGFRLAGQCLPAEQVGGDLFQYYPLPDGQVMVCLADVTGHAMAAAIPVVLFNGMLTTQIELASGPGDLCTRLDAAVRRNLDRRTLVCFAAGQLDPAHRRLRLSNAGCPYPLHYRASTDSVCELSSGQAYPLGAGSPQEHTAYEVTLEPGDRVALFSDGIMEAEDARGAPFGFERTIAAMHRACAEGRDADGVIAALFAEVEGFAQGAARTDDQTAVVIEAVAR